MTSPIAQIAATEARKQEIRDVVELIAREALAFMTPEGVADKLAVRAYFVNDHYRARREGSDWPTTAEETLRRLRDGRIATPEDVLREIANRNLSSGTRPTR